ncbi:MAG TPA: right-handed parallel beta-helix repeat-containing protein [Anaerolineae bacterium]|nr:right-handed parallel beta-helix repeat-containing protein [Anaerolineae bacterium]
MNKKAVLFLCFLVLIGCSPSTTIPTQEIQDTKPGGSQALITQSPPPTHSVTSPSFPFVFSFPDFQLDTLIQQLPATCPGIGSRAYSEPPIDPAVLSQSDEIPIVLTRGAVIVVTTDSDKSNGNTSSLEALITNPGTDGVSLREALLVTNHDPGEYTIQFNPGLSGAAIQVGSWDHTELPPLEGGSVIINGDIDGDLEPDIKLINAVAELTEFNAIFGFRIHSSNNTVHALELTDFTVGVFFDAPSSNQVYRNNTVDRMVIEGQGGIGLYSSQGSEASITETNNRWEDIRVIGNRISIHNGSGISFSMHWAAMESIEHLTILDNHILMDGGGNAIELSPGFGAGSNGNQIEQVLIANNVIEGNPQSGIALLAGFMGAGSNSIGQVTILGNTIRGSYSYEEFLHTSGMHISAGFWINQDGNEISDILVADNYIEGNSEISILLSSGAVGSSGNLVERIRFSNNHIKVTQHSREDRVPVMAIGITTGDGASDYYDPNYQPVVYPNDNILRDVWFSGNLIEGQGGYGVMVSTGDPGSERNHVERIYMLGNEFRPFFPEAGILVSAISLEHGGIGDNVISEVFIQQNSIHYTNLREEFDGSEFVSGGIVLSAGNGTSFSQTRDVWIVANEVTSPAPGINLVAGWAQPQFPPSIGNTIRHVRLWCNTVVQNPDLLESLFPGIKGINLAGGWGLAQDNQIKDIYVTRNLVAGVEDDISIFESAGEGSQGNLVLFP